MLIQILSSKLNDERVSCQESPNGVDTLIVHTTIHTLIKSDNFTIVGQDVDMLVFLTVKNIYLNSVKNVYLYNAGQEKIETQVFSLQQHKKGLKNIILLIHSLVVTQHHLVTGRGKLPSAKYPIIELCKCSVW